MWCRTTLRTWREDMRCTYRGSSLHSTKHFPRTHGGDAARTAASLPDGQGAVMRPLRLGHFQANADEGHVSDLGLRRSPHAIGDESLECHNDRK
jgi:hypothetical protein